MAYPKCPNCRKDIKAVKINRNETAGYCYHECYKCHEIMAVTPD